MKDIFKLFGTPRKGQPDLCKLVLETIENGKRLLCEAPTGYGKTISVLVPIKKSGRRCLYITPRNTQHDIIIDNGSKIGLRVVSLFSKQKMCINRIVKEHPNFYDSCLSLMKKNKEGKYLQDLCNFRIKARMSGTQMYGLKVNDLIKECEMAGVCPYEVVSQTEADVVSANFYHLFSPSIRKHFLDKFKIDASQTILVVDEAHNIPNIIRDIQSDRITMRILNGVEKEVKELVGYSIYIIIYKIIKRLNSQILGLIKPNTKTVLEKDSITVTEKEISTLFRAGEIIIDKRKNAGKIVPDSKIHSLVSFLCKWTDADDVSFVRVMNSEMKRWNIELKSLEPAVEFNNAIQDFQSVVMMSGTLQPINYFKKVLGLEDCMSKVFPKIFPPENRRLFVDDNVTTKYTERNDMQWQEYGRRISDIANKTKGNTLCVFPSYKMIQDVSPYLVVNKQIVEENPENKLKIHKLIENRKNLVLAVARGSLSEGIDYPNNLLRAVIIAGFPFPSESLEHKALVQYCNKKYGPGFLFASLFPTINHCLQVAGRGIRSEKDVCDIHLLDKRFAGYRRYFG